MLPVNRAEFKTFILQELGAPVINIEVADSQVEQAIDLALSYYTDYHYDATIPIYYAIRITQEMIDNKYITIPENIIGISRIFPISSAVSTTGLFDIKYQIAANDILTATDSSISPYYAAMTNIELINQILTGETPIRYNRNMNKLFIDTNWGKFSIGSYIMAECTQVLDPDTYSDIWKDRWLIKYATALVKKHWGNNTKKYNAMTLPGQMQFSGQRTYDEAIEEIRMLEQKMLQGYALPILDMIR